MEVDEAGSGDLDAGDIGAGRQRVDQGLGQGARIAARRLGQQHGGIGGEVAVLAGLGTLDGEVRGGGLGGQGAGLAQGVDALGDAGTQIGFHGVLARWVTRDRTF
ncbi:hypothetical protein QE438_002423 [Pseudoxanthomonas sp. SORGH_AS 997]|nr:hypothetical protein [Pseudoxanthomonas sp. SORGH_AS_0997]